MALLSGGLGNVATCCRSFIQTRPSRRKLKQSGILKERVFGCDLGEHLMNTGRDSEYWAGREPMTSRDCRDGLREGISWRQIGLLGGWMMYCGCHVDVSLLFSLLSGFPILCSMLYGFATLLATRVCT